MLLNHRWKRWNASSWPIVSLTSGEKSNVKMRKNEMMKMDRPLQLEMMTTMMIQEQSHVHCVVALNHRVRYLMVDRGKHWQVEMRC